MDDKTRARKYYDEALTLFQDPLVKDCEKVIKLLEKSLNLCSDSDVSVLIEDTWHYLLKSLDSENDLGSYDKYRASPVWKRKRDLVMERDKGICVWCGDEGKVVHHQTYDNIGKESASDLILLCGKCHDTAHLRRVPSDKRSTGHRIPRVPSDHQPDTQQPSHPEEVTKAFIAYIDRESDILQLGDFGRDGHRDYVDFESGYPTKNRSPEIYLSAWLPVGWNDVAALISIRADSIYFESHYKKFEEHKDKIETIFLFDEVKPRSIKGGRVYHLRVVKKGVNMMQTVDRDAAFRWLRETLEKLYWALRVHDTLGWDRT